MYVDRDGNEDVAFWRFGVLAHFPNAVCEAERGNADGMWMGGRWRGICIYRHDGAMVGV